MMMIVYQKLIVSVLLLCTCFSFVFTQEEGSKCRLPITNKPGICKLATQCLSAFEAKKQGIDPVICSYYFNEPIVCCKDESIPESNNNRFPEHDVFDSNVFFPGSVVPSRQRKAEQKCVEYSKLLVQTVQAIPLVTNPEPITAEVPKCDYNSLPLIVDGKPAEPGEFPHMALLGYRNGNKIDWNCGGTLISHRFILTAAHCLLQSRIGLPFRVRLGELNLASTDDGSEPQDYEIERIIKHPNYKLPQKYNDIGLIQLATRVNFNEFIRPACLWTKYSMKHNKTIATGWGHTEFGGRRSDILLKVALDIIDNNYCNSLYQDVRRALPRGIESSMICAGVLAGKKDTCQGDSGGPIQVTSNDNQCLYYVIGITSFGKGCGSVNSPAVYTRVAEYIDWIEKIVWP